MARKKEAGIASPASHGTSIAAPISTQTQPGAGEDASNSIEADNLNLIKKMGAAQVSGLRLKTECFLDYVHFTLILMSSLQ